MERFADETDVLIVGGGPAGMTTAIKLKQLAAENDMDLKVTIVEKASEIGIRHVLSLKFYNRMLGFSFNIKILFTQYCHQCFYPIFFPNFFLFYINL